MSNLNLGQTEALTIAQNAFNANYGPNPPAVSIAFTTDSNNNMLVNVSASVTLNTFFLRILSGFKTLSVAPVRRPRATRLLCRWCWTSRTR